MESYECTWNDSEYLYNLWQDSVSGVLTSEHESERSVLRSLLQGLRVKMVLIRLPLSISTRFIKTRVT